MRKFLEVNLQKAGKGIKPRQLACCKLGETIKEDISILLASRATLKSSSTTKTFVELSDKFVDCLLVQKFFFCKIISPS